MRLLIVDDHEVVRQGIRSLLSEQAEWEVCGEAVDGQDALEKACELKPDLIVMDVSMPRLNGLEATRQVRSMLPACEVLILSQHENGEMARQALKAGARGYVVKTSVSKDLIAAITKVSRHDYFFDPQILDQKPSAHTDVQEILQRSAAFAKALRESEERFRNLAEYQSAVMHNMAEGLYALDANGLLTLINRAGEAILGWTRDELLGKKMHDVTHYKRPDGSPYPASECPGLLVLQRGAVLQECEEFFIRKDGSFVPVVFSSAPLNEDGKITGVIVSFRDDTEQRSARAALQKSEQQLLLEYEALRKLNECTSRLWQTRNLADGLTEMLAAVIDLVGADKGNVQLLDRERRILAIEAQRGFDNDFLDFFREVSAVDDSACGRALRTGERIVIEDVEEDAAYTPYREIARTAGYRAVTSTPLIGIKGSPLGILSTHFRLPHRPSDAELRRLDLYARQAADFIERCRTEEAVRLSEERFRSLSQKLDLEVQDRTKALKDKNANLLRQSELLRELSYDLFHTQDEERRHIARELHDSAGQLLAALGMSLDQAVREAEHAAPTAAKRLGEVQALVQQLNREIRTTSYLLHPPLLDESGLSSALRLYSEGVNERSEIAVTLDIPEDFERLPGDMELAIFRVVQECVTNIHRHSGSKTALIRASRGSQNIRVEIRDEGRGIPLERLTDIQSGVSGVGVRGMQERLRQFRGTLKIESDGSGTRVLVTIPIPKKVGSTDVKPLQTAMQASTLSATAKPASL
jgi:PAS domain S-box-containing protein